VGDTRLVRYRLPQGTESEASLGPRGPLMVDDDVLVLASRDGQQSLVIREDGYPLLLAS
jgi:hypothetical protein